MGCSVKLIKSSIAEDTGIRLDTFQVRYWRPIHGEVMTHRVFSRNASSSRAIPNASILIREETYIPRFRKNKPGMQPGDFLSVAEQAEAARLWAELANITREYVARLSDKNGLNIHKQWVNRPTEWFSYIDVLITSTEWSNFDWLRIHPDAQDEIRELATEMKRVRDNTIPHVLKQGEWHLPYVTEEDVDDVTRMFRGRAKLHPVGVDEVLDQLARTKLGVSARDAILLAMAAARCCRISYAKHDGERPTIENDMDRFLQLAGSSPLHASPLEHQGRPLTAYEDERLSGNLIGWAQFRKFLPNECM